MFPESVNEFHTLVSVLPFLPHCLGGGSMDKWTNLQCIRRPLLVLRLYSVFWHWHGPKSWKYLDWMEWNSDAVCSPLSPTSWITSFKSPVWAPEQTESDTLDYGLPQVISGTQILNPITLSDAKASYSTFPHCLLPYFLRKGKKNKNTRI